MSDIIEQVADEISGHPIGWDSDVPLGKVSRRVTPWEVVPDE